MSSIQMIVVTTLVYSLAFIAASLAFVRLCDTILLHPTRLFWRVKRRETAPKCLTDAAYGNHEYLPLQKVSVMYCVLLPF